MEKFLKFRNPYTINQPIDFINYLTIQPVSYLTDTETAGLPLEDGNSAFLFPDIRHLNDEFCNDKSIDTCSEFHPGAQSHSTGCGLH
jgi:hypothetical protein